MCVCVCVCVCSPLTTDVLVKYAMNVLPVGDGIRFLQLGVNFVTSPPFISIMNFLNGFKPPFHNAMTDFSH